MPTPDVTVNANEATRTLNRIESYFRLARQAMSRVGSLIVARNLERTARGVDYTGQRFKPYSASYKKFRAKEGLPVNRVDLLKTGQMTSGATYRLELGGLRVRAFFEASGTSPNPAEKAAYNYATREHWGLSNKDIQDIEKLQNDEIERYING